MSGIELHPENARLYRRTDDQLVSHAEHTKDLSELHPHISGPQVSHLADLRMEKAFYVEIDRIAEERAIALQADAKQLQEAEFTLSKQTVMKMLVAEITEIHQVLPLPAIAAQGVTADV